MNKLIHRTIALTLGLSISVLVFAGLETGTYISDLVSTNPLNTDSGSQGDDHIRLLKSTIKTTFPNINGAVTATDETLNTALVETTGSFAPTYTGFSSAPTGLVIDWRKHGNLVTVYASAIGASGTSNATTFQITNVPADIRPTIQRICYTQAVDNGAGIGAAIDITASSATWQITIGRPDSVASRIQYLSSSWTASGSKGLASTFACTYAL